MTLHLGQLLRLSIADILDEWPFALAVTLAIAAVLAPLLVLNGLQTGVVGEIFERLRADPAMRRITLDATGARRFDGAWFEAMRERPDIAFVLPSTRFAAAQVDITPVDKPGAAPIRVSLVPTGAGDPVFGPQIGENSDDLGAMSDVKISADVAAQTRLAAGDRLFIDVERRRGDGRIEAAGIDAKVLAVAAPERHGGAVVFVRPDLLLAIEAFRDGFAAPELGNAEGEARPARDVYPNFRLYARRIEDVAGLARYLREDQDLSVSTQEARIASAVALDANIGAVLRAIVILGAIGLAGSLAAIQWAVAARKRRIVAMLNLIGYGRSWLIGFPTVQAVILALTGSAAATGLAYGAALWINRFFAASFGATGEACAIKLAAVLIGMGIVLLFSLLPAAGIGLHFARLEPSDEIREI
jgi:putative ABC transport system permease protein